MYMDPEEEAISLHFRSCPDLKMNRIYRLLKTSQQCEMPTSTLMRMALISLKKNYSSYGKDITVHSDTPPGHGQDILLQNMKSATDVSDILYSVKMHHTIMNDRHSMQAIRTIFLLQKSDNSNMSNGEVINNNGFRVLCQTLKNQVRALDVSDILDALKTLSYLGVPATSKLVQILLQLITKEINELSLHQILFFDFLIKDFQSCPLVDALRIALPIVLEANMRMKLDRQNLPLITDLLHFASKKSLSQSTLDFLVDNLMRKRNDIDFKCAKSIVRSICDLKYPNESHRPLLHHSLDVIIENEHNCTYSDFDTLISKLASKYSSKTYYFYNEEFMNTASRFIVRNDSGFDEAVWILRKATKFGHVCINLLDYIATKAEINPTLLENCGTILLFTVVSGFAQADYRPSNWPALENLILKNATSRLGQVELPWVKFARDLCTLDCWPFDIFCTIFSSFFLEKYLARDYNTLDYLQLLSLYQSVSALCAWYNGPWPPRSILEKAIEINSFYPHELPLLPYLEKGLGSDRYFLNGVRTKSGHFIDHVIIFRKGCYPVALPQITDTSTKVYFEDLPDYEECKKISIVFIPASSYSSNTGKLKGPSRLSLNTLELAGTLVVPISSVIWNQLLENEKVNYLMHEIQSKCNDIPFLRGHNSNP